MSPEEKDYEKVYREFWKPLIEKDGKLSMDALMRELFDYYIMMGDVSKVYDHITDGKWSKPHYKAEAMIAAADDWCKEAVERRMQEYMSEQDPSYD